jgi:hypothetical protein
MTHNFIHNRIESQRLFSLGKMLSCVRKRAGRKDVCTVNPALIINAIRSVK